MHILVIDNYDSFTYNLVHYLEDLDCTVTVKRNDQLTIEEVADYDKIVLSPGPGIPDEAGLLKPIIYAYAKTKPILGVCLGTSSYRRGFWWYPDQPRQGLSWRSNSHSGSCR